MKPLPIVEAELNASLGVYEPIKGRGTRPNPEMCPQCGRKKMTVTVHNFRAYGIDEYECQASRVCRRCAYQDNVEYWWHHPFGEIPFKGVVERIRYYWFPIMLAASAAFGLLLGILRG